MQDWFIRGKYYDNEGVYVLDQTHCVVPDNNNYKDAVMLPVDEHGQLYRGLEKMPKEERRALKYHPCYSLSLLMHISRKKQSFHIAGYEWGPGSEDELSQADSILKQFHKVHKTGTMKLLIVDRGYISGKFITFIKGEYECDVLLPLRTNMDQYKDAIALSKLKETKWEAFDERDEESGYLLARYKACTIKDIILWDECKVKLYTTVVEKEYKKDDKWEKRKWVLATTRKFRNPMEVVRKYALRVTIEERNRQFKNFWEIAQFPSPSASLMESQVCFTLLAHSLLQSYLLRKDLERETNKTITTLRGEDSLGINNVVTYVDDRYAVYDTKEAFGIINNLNTEKARERLQSWINKT
jgi:hypothetical protein